MAQKPESKFWKKFKAETPEIIWTRIENWASFGTPDLLGYNKNHTYFTVELKVSKSKKLTISPHQILYCTQHPKNHFILATTHVSPTPKLYEGGQISAIREQGIACESIACDWDAIRLWLYRL